MAFHIPQDTTTWMTSEWQDYLHPQGWTEKKADPSRRMTFFKREHGDSHAPHFRLQGVISAPSARIVNIVHTNAAAYDKHLDPNTLQSVVIQRLTKEQLGGLADEGVVYYRQTKLPFVDNRDFVTLTLVKTLVNPTTQRKVTAFFTRSVEHPSAPRTPPAGFTRAMVVSCCAFIEEGQGGSLYTFTNKTDAKLSRLLAGPASKGTESYMFDYFSRLSQLSTSM